MVVRPKPPSKFWTICARKIKQKYPKAKFKKPDLSPAIGAAIFAGKYVGESPDDFYRKVLLNTSK